MANKRQKLARKRFKEAHPELFPKPQPTPPKDPTIKSKKSKLKPRKKKLKPDRGDKSQISGASKKPNLRKRPLRIPGMKPGESCFICKAQDHIAKLCPKKTEWEKNKICLLCRQRGHSLKNCPNKSDSIDKKHCYNCGEVGHSLSNCPQPIQDGGTKFANCFICNKSGHLSKNCPQNTHGIYPKGGSCKICGGVTHLAKYCPNKGKANSTAKGLENTFMSNENGANGQGQVMVFGSGDDLADDFMVDDTTNGSKCTRSEGDSNAGDEAERSNAKPKKKQGPRVVNFVG